MDLKKTISIVCVCFMLVLLVIQNQKQAEKTVNKEGIFAFDALNIYQSILQEYERAWIDESYTVEEWKQVDTSLNLFKGSRQYILCYSLSDLTGDGTDELIIKFLNREPCIIYAYNRDQNTVVEVWANIERPITIYEDGVFESLWGAGGVNYYDYYQIQKNTGCTVYLDEFSNDQLWEDNYYKGDMEIQITKEEFWEAIKSYESLPQLDLTWHILEGFWEPDTMESISGKTDEGSLDDIYMKEKQEHISNISDGQCEFYKVGDDEYGVILYSKDNKIVESLIFSREPAINKITEHIIEISFSMSNLNRYTFYFDTEKSEMSDIYLNAKLFGDKYIAYMKSNVNARDTVTLVLVDIFKEMILYQEIKRDFSMSVDPMSAVISIEMIDDINIRLEYYKGEEKEIVSEIIAIYIG